MADTQWSKNGKLPSFAVSFAWKLFDIFTILCFFYEPLGMIDRNASSVRSRWTISSATNGFLRRHKQVTSINHVA